MRLIENRINLLNLFTALISYKCCHYFFLWCDFHIIDYFHSHGMVVEVHTVSNRYSVSLPYVEKSILLFTPLTLLIKLKRQQLKSSDFTEYLSCYFWRHFYYDYLLDFVSLSWTTTNKSPGWLL